MPAHNACLDGENGLMQPPHIIASHGYVKHEPYHATIPPRASPTAPEIVKIRPLPGFYAPISGGNRTASMGQSSLGRRPICLDLPIQGASWAGTQTASTTIGKVEDGYLQLRCCAGINCTLTLPSDLPHLRCRTCRANDVPRRPDLETVLTPAQLRARDRNSRAPPPPPPPLAFPPFPSRVTNNALANLPEPPRIISPREPPIIKTEPDIDADLALQALLLPTPEDDSTIDVDALELSYPDDEFALLYPDSTPPPPITPPSPTRPPIMNAMLPPSRLPSFPTPIPRLDIPPLPSRKRRKISAEPISSLPSRSGSSALWSSSPLETPNRPAPPPPLRAAIPPLPSRIRPTQSISALSIPQGKPSSSRFKPCSAPQCINVLNANSPASRCMACISRDWKSKRAEAVEAASAIEPKKKVVTWSVSHSRKRSGEEHDEFNFSKILQDASSSSSSPSGTTPVPNSPGSQNSSDSEGGTGDSESESSGEEVPPAPIRTGLKFRLPARTKVAVKSEFPAISPLSEAQQSPFSTSSSPPPITPTDSDHVPSSPTLIYPSSSSSSPTPVPPTRGSITPTPTRSSFSEPEEGVAGSRPCSGPRCHRKLAPDYQWKSCVMCRAAARGYQRKRKNLQGGHSRLDEELEEHLAAERREENENENENGDGDEDGALASDDDELYKSPVSPASKKRKKRSLQSMKVDIEPFEDDDPGRTFMEGARPCSIKDCPHILPPWDEYTWKMCAKCRQTSKENRLRSHGIVVPRDVHHKTYRHEITGPKAFAMKQPDGRCLSYDCGVLISPEFKYPYCGQCRLRDWKLKRLILRHQALRELEEGERVSPKGDDEGNDLKPKPLFIKIPALKNRLHRADGIESRPPAPYPEYKNLGALLDNFRSLSKTFFDAQTMHFAHQPTHSKPPISIFIFDGEFSVVAPNYDVANRKERDRVVSTIQREVQQAARLEFAPKRWMTLLNQGLVTRFVCWREPMQITVPTPPDRRKAGRGPTMQVKSYHRTMEGELEIATFADRSHPFIPGERTVVRVRLVG